MLDVFLVRLDDQPQTSCPGDQQLLGYLDPGRREAVAGMKSRRAREQSLAAHLLVRVAVSRTLTISNRGLQMAVGTHGKPFFPHCPQVHFSLAHTRRAAVAAVSDHAVGVDIEWVRRANPKIARRFFTPREQEYIAAGREDQRFLEVWTRKEACVKWAGQTLGRGLGSVDVLSPRWTGRLHTMALDEWMLSVCGELEGETPPLTRLTWRELTELVEKLDPFD